MENKQVLLNNIDKVHTTVMGVDYNTFLKF